MSYWIHLEKEDGTMPEVESFAEGGTQMVGGSTHADLNVTYNYSKIFSIKEELDGKRAGDTLSLLKEKVAELGTETSDDYWEATDGNVGHTLEILRRWAEQFPECIWRVS